MTWINVIYSLRDMGYYQKRYGNVATSNGKITDLVNQNNLDFVSFFFRTDGSKPSEKAHVQIDLDRYS